MSDFAGFDLDRSTERAWSRFSARLADHVADMAGDDVLVVSAQSGVDVEDEGSAPYVQFCVRGETLLRSEVASNAYLADAHQLCPDSVARVAALGWSAPTVSRGDEDAGEGSANFFLDLERSEADRLAVMATTVLREVFGVPHPAFLSAGRLGEPTPDLGVPTGADVPVETTVEAPAVFPRSRDHLRALVDRALTPYFGHVPRHDEDDDIPVVTGSTLLFVRVMERQPALELFCCVVHAVSDRERAAEEVAVLNRDETFLKFVLAEDRVMTYLHLPAYPFAPEHLRAMLTVMSRTLDDLDDVLAEKVGGHRMFEDEEPSASLQDETAAAAEAVHPAMMTLLQLDAETPGSLTPELAASVCGMDRELVLELIAWNSQQEIAWRRARDQALVDGRTEEAGVCAVETGHAECAVNLLRRTLRLLVEQQPGRDVEERGYAVTRRPQPPAGHASGLDPGDSGSFDQP